MFTSLVTPLLEAQRGGAQAFACDLAAALERRGHRVVVYCAEGSHLPGRELVTVPVPALRRALWRPGRPEPTPLPALGEAFERLLARVRQGGHDAVSGHAFDAEAIEQAQDLPVLHTLHLPPPAPRVLASAQQTGSHFAAVSAACARQWRSAGLAEVETIRNGSPDFVVTAVRPRPWALIAGRVSPEKGTAAAIRVARRSGLEVRLAGSVYDRAYWRREVRRRVSNLPRTTLWELMARCSVCLMPVDWEEPYGLVAAEAQLAGCPVVGYRRGGLAEVVKDGSGGYLVAPGDEDGLAEAVSRALQLDRVQIRNQARRRLLIGRCTAAYERSLRRIAGL
ncbi:MAG TPA: glycosyltransferase [Candidatus Acidoferrales bacterium]|nr:glycosyltransferase [Candidatus Acidoferrales bacterium]